MKDFLKPTKIKISITILIMVIFLIERRITACQDFPEDTLFFKLDKIIYTVVSILTNIFQLAIDLFIYYFLACLFLFIANQILKKKKRK